MAEREALITLKHDEGEPPMLITSYSHLSFLIVTGLKTTVYDLELKITDISDDLDHLQDVLPERFQEEYLATEKTLGEEATLDNLEKTFTGLGLGQGAFEVAKE